MNAPRRISPSGDPFGCSECEYDENGVCIHCGCTIDMVDVEGHCACVEESGYCWCPIGDGWQVWLFMAMLAAGYGCFVIRRREKVVKSEE